MFIREKRNPSGVISVQVISKIGGKYKVLKTIGSSKNADELVMYVSQARLWIKSKQKQREIDFGQGGTSDELSLLLENIEELTVSGIDLLLGKIFDDIGFGCIEDIIFRHLVLMRLCYPASKLKTTAYLQRYQAIRLDVQQVYRYLDKLYDSQKLLVQQISYGHTVKVLSGKLSILFYDVTTLYFEIDTEDSLRKRGFSKDGKHQHPQIILGLLVSTDGYPVAYELFEGNKFEGHTLLPVLDKFKQTYGLDKLIVVADAGMLSKQNMQDLLEQHYEFIIGARIKNETEAIKAKIQALKLGNGQSTCIRKPPSLRLIVSYSESRAKKDKLNRERGIKKLRERIKSGNLTKNHLNNRGYNKYLTLSGAAQIGIDEIALLQDVNWDGLKGYLTNTELSKEEIICNYGHLWKIEKAFRISKHDLKIRPVYHRLPERIEAHICIAFVAYKIYKELERLLYEKQAGFSPETAIEIAKTIYAIKVRNPHNNQVLSRTLLLTQEQKTLAKLFNF